MKIGVDVGRSSGKATIDQQRLLGLPVVCALPQGEDDQSLASRALNRCNGTVHLESWVLRYQDQRWVMGERVEALGLPGQYAMTVRKADPMTRLLILGTLTALTTDDAIEGCVPLPVPRVRQEGAAMAARLQGEHRVGVGGQERRIRLAGVMAFEGLGLWMKSVVTDPAGPPDPALVAQRTVVLDFGNRTVHTGLVCNGTVQRRPSGSTHGSSEVWESAIMQVAEGRGGTVDASLHRAALVAAMLRSGAITGRGKRLPRVGGTPSDRRARSPRSRRLRGRARCGPPRRGARGLEWMRRGAGRRADRPPSQALGLTEAGPLVDTATASPQGGSGDVPSRGHGTVSRAGRGRSDRGGHRSVCGT